MKGRIRRRALAQKLDALPPPVAGDPLCALCARPIPPAQQDAHHLVPRSQGGTRTVLLHRICHRQLHALLTEVELARDYGTVEALLAHPAVARFVPGVRTNPPGFAERTRRSKVKGRNDKGQPTHAGWP